MTLPDPNKALLFRSLHEDRTPLVLPNAWDVASARITEAAGAPAVATTSAGVAWSLGFPDGDHLDRKRAVDLVGRIAAAVDVPVTADIESGYAGSPDGVAATVEGVLRAGAVGINLEDTEHSGPPRLRPVEEQCERLRAARQAAESVGVPLFINARIDTYLRAVDDPDARLRGTLDRAPAYVAAGAGGVFVPGVTEPATVEQLVEGVSAPLNVMAGPGAPTIEDLAKLGVARVSLGAAIAQAAYALVAATTREVLTAGRYSTLAALFDYGELNELLRSRPEEA